jgi:hypothetical protein
MRLKESANMSLRTIIKTGIAALWITSVLNTCQSGLQAQDVKPAKGEAQSITGLTMTDDQRRNQNREFALGLITTLGNEAKSYRDGILRPRVLARAADVIWTADHSAAQSLFRQAWEAAEKADKEVAPPKKDAPSMITAIRRLDGRDLRSEVLSLVARRDRVLADEFLAKLKNESDTQSANDSKRSGDGWNTNDVLAKRLRAADDLLKAGQVESALSFAGPALNQVTTASIAFLTNLRAKNADIADRTFAALLTRTEVDPLADANTVSGLSTYAFTPGFYITFSTDGGAFWSQADQEVAPPNLSPGLRTRFFEVAGAVLLRPLPAPEQDFTSAGRRGKYQVIKRLLPLFDQYSPDTAVALHAQLAALGDNSTTDPAFDAQAVNRATPTPADLIEKMQFQIDRAKTSKDRDEIYAATALKLTLKGDTRAHDIASRIDDSARRAIVLQYVDFEFVRAAIQKKRPQEAARLAKSGQLAHAQRAWAYTRIAGSLPESQRQSALDYLADAANEIRHVDENPRDRAILWIGLARGLLKTDIPLAWETVNEAVKAANQAENFTGDNLISFSIGTQAGIRFTQIGNEDGGLAGLFQLLAAEDLYRAVDMAKTFNQDAPRAAATLAIANSLLNK